MSRNQISTQVGLGLRRELFAPLKSPPSSLQFLELAPENWIEVGGKLQKELHYFAERFPIYCHGLSLSLGGQDPLNFDLLKKIKKFLNEYKVEVYSEHLSYCSDKGYLYDLLPIPMTEAAVKHVSKRIKTVQDFLERKIAVENASTYLIPPISTMKETEFIQVILEEADCEMLLDVNNVYVNSVNHRFDPVKFLKEIPGDRIRYLHVAGHYQKNKNLIIDTHGEAVIDPVWDLLNQTYQIHGLFPTLLERDFNIPPFKELLKELERIQSLQEKNEKLRLSA
jgi:uncharacterized protein (UPF0276 family)